MRGVLFSGCYRVTHYGYSLSGNRFNTPHKITTDLKPVIRDRDAFELERAKETVMDFLDDNLFFTEMDIVFLKEFQNGSYRPKLIFRGETLKRIENHPMAIWKTQKNRDRDRSNGGEER